ncbi:MAG TPA: tyrosine--tRNA ligase [Candidatus Lokiarchaeia archaeon]|nr:tyrosine--tRNA ligase [Candidatus Lokiarchaeia archaeon]
MSTLSVEERLDLIKRNTEEILGEDDLIKLLENDEPLKHYIGFEISGRIHIGTGLMCMSKVRDFMNAGVQCSIFLADWHSWINDKLGGDLDVIKEASNYFKEGLKASLRAVGGDPDKVNFVLGTDLYHNADDYWACVIDISKHTTLNRVLRSTTIMGRKEGENIDFAKLIYPPMQVADIFYQGVNLAHAGLDQRKAHVIARDCAMQLKVKPLLNSKGEQIKPVAVHHHLLLGLQKPPKIPETKEEMQELLSTMKMSKSIPDSAIFVTDEPEVIKKKLQKAFCPERNVDFNPVLDWTKSLIFRDEQSVLEITRPEKYGGDKAYESYNALVDDFIAGALHPADLKSAVVTAITTMLEPIREHFNEPEMQRMKERMDEMTITR